MLIKLTHKEIIDMLNALGTLSNKELPILLTYKVVENTEKLMNVYNVYAKSLEKAKGQEEISQLLKIEKDVNLELLDKQELIEAGLTLTPIQLVGLKRLIDG